MKAGSHLKIKSFGDAALGVELEGNPQKPEPIHFRAKLPFGDVDIVRCSDNSYWVHTRINSHGDGQAPDRRMGKFINGRLDIIGKHTSDVDAGDFKNPKLYHVAVRINDFDVLDSIK